ncbi:hypothetical protein N8G13_02845 [Mycoplasma zalophi]|uniref:hypothetical protein n=1 Tax=Mycoplasma zalophi TaxID=191287 RepID=UPI0021C64D03|nr:hypothetical protein [Mycoplasma zalophi]MCU4117380.1 hypothetical protein [Mycoplasma zalophi]
MRKKILISSLVLATIPAIAAVSCAPQNTETNEEKTIKELNAKLAKIKKENQTEKEQLQAQLDALRQRLETTNQQKDESDQTKTRLEQEIEELQEKINELEAKRVKRNDKSAKKFFEQISNFLATDLPNAIKQQNPNSYNSNRDLLDGVTQSIEKSKEELKDTPEDFSNLWTWENAILFSLNRADIITKFIDDPQNPVTVNIPKLTEMDDLFDWRINDIDRIMSQIRTSDVDNKEALLAEFEEYKKAYQDAKTNSSLLTHQISNWQKLEKQGEGIASKFIDFSSTNYRSLLPKFNMPNFRISLFPVYRKIVDEEFKKQTKDKLAKLLANYKTLFSKSATDFITSVSYHKLHEKVKAELLKISAALVDDNLSYFNEFELWEDVDRFVYEANNTLLEGFFVDNKELKQKIDNEVSREFDLSTTNSFARVFKNKYESKTNEGHSDYNYDNHEYLYKDFYTKNKNAMQRIFNLPHTTYVESFDRYQEYLTVRKEIELSESLINLFKDLGDDLEDPELKALIKWDNSEENEKIQNQINQEETAKQKATENYEEQKTEIQKLIFEYEDTKATKEYLSELSTTSQSVLDAFTTNFAENGKWFEMYSTSGQILDLLTNHNKLISDAKNDTSLEGEALKDKIKEIKKSVENVQSTMFPVKKDLTSAPAFYVLLTAHISYNYGDIDQESLDEQSKILKDLKEFSAYFNNYDVNNSKDQIKTDIDEKEQNVEQYLNALQDITIYGHEWADLRYADEGADEIVVVKDSLIKKINTLKSKMNEIKELLNNDNPDTETVKTKLEELKQLTKELDTYVGSSEQDEVLTYDYQVLQQDHDNTIESLKNKKRRNDKAAKTAKLVPGQEIFVLLREWKNNKKANFDTILLSKEDHQDKVLAKFLNDEKDAVSRNNHFNAILAVDGTTNSWSFETDDESKEIQEVQKTYEQFTALEEAYAQSLLSWINKKDTDDANQLKEDLKQKRHDYYTFLNGLKDKKIILESKHIRFSPSLYDKDGENNERFVAATLLSFYAKIESTTEIMQNIYDTYIK